MFRDNFDVRMDKDQSRRYVISVICICTRKVRIAQHRCYKYREGRASRRAFNKSAPIDEKLSAECVLDAST